MNYIDNYNYNLKHNCTRKKTNLAKRTTTIICNYGNCKKSYVNPFLDDLTDTMQSIVAVVAVILFAKYFSVLDLFECEGMVGCSGE